MRYIGNKTRLLDFIGDVLDERGIRDGAAVDPFTGTASVARMLKERDFRVVASDLMEYAYVFGRAYVEVAAPPDLRELAAALDVPEPAPDDASSAADAPAADGGREPAESAKRDSARAALDAVVAYLNRIPPDPGFVHEHYTPAGEKGARHGRMYFTPPNAARLDAIRSTLHRWRGEGEIDDDGLHVLLAALIEAADRVANTTGVYASFVKSWQPNAERPLRLRRPPIVEGNGCRAAREGARALIEELEPFDLLYLDPPYNGRQYPGYYHIPELIAVGWFDEPPELRGKTGLLPDADKRSDWARPARCEAAFEALVASADCRHIVMSYNTEGIIPESTIERVLKAYGRRGTYERYERRYRRYRSDSDGENRRYSGDEVKEYLYCVDR